MERNIEPLSVLPESATSGTGAQAVERALQLLSIVGRRAEKASPLAMWSPKAD
jgi:hypothetical protein